MTESLELFSNMFDKLERENKKKNERTKDLEETIDILTGKNIKVWRDIDELEQYSHRNCLLLRGVQENEKENTDGVLGTLYWNVRVTLYWNQVKRSRIFFL